MYLKVILIVCLAFISVTNSFGQDIQQIRNEYNTYAAQISACENGEDECHLYCNTHKTNALNQVWRGVGEYNSSLKYWYDDSPNNCDDCGENGIQVLKKVIKKTVSGQSSMYEEWLFSDGALSFYYLILEEEETTHYRHYFADNILFSYHVNGDNIDPGTLSKQYVSDLFSQAKKLQNAFLLGF